MVTPILLKHRPQQHQTYNNPNLQSPSRSINSNMSESSSTNSITFKMDSEPQSPDNSRNSEVVYLKITPESPNGENTIQIQTGSPLSEVIDNQNEIASNNNTDNSNSNSNNNGSSISLKKSLKFKPSSVTSWRSRRRHSHITSPTIIEVNEAKSRPTFNIPKATKRLSSNFIPKRFSSLSSFNSFASASQNSFEVDSILYPPLIHEIPDQNKSTTLSENSSSSSSFILPSSSPISPKHNERLDSVSSSTPSEKSAITKSLTMFKRTTKSILFLDSSSPSISQNSTPSTSKFSESVIEFPPSMPICRRSISCNNDDQLQQPISPMKDLNPYPNSSFPSEEVTPSKVDFNEPDAESAAQSLDKVRQRSKTLNALENPLIDLNNNNNSGLLSSIANFVKINRSNPPATPHTVSSSNSIPSIKKKDTLSLIEGETPETYLDRIMTIYPLTSIATVLSIDDNEFLKSSFEYFMNRFFNFVNDPLDIALRKFIMINDLPKETQQIDRVIYQFGRHFSEQHPELHMDIDTCYILTYSLIMVHTDRFNPNNKRKMTRFEYQENVLSTLKNNSGLKTDSNDLTELITKEVMGYYFDNIVHCPFIKISVDQSDLCLEALKSPGKALPYPSALFLNSGEVLHEDENKSVTSSCISSSPSSPVLQLQPQPQIQSTVLRKRSSTFLWNSASPTDPYEYIIQNKIEKLRLDLPFTCLNPFISTKVTFRPEESISSIPSLTFVEAELNKFVEEKTQKKLSENILYALTSSHCSMALKVPKSKGSFLLSSRMEAKPINMPIKTANEYYITRIIKIGVISRQESKILSNVKTWKRYFCILTPVGLFFFKNVALFKMHYCGTEFNKKTVVLEEAPTSSTTTNLLESFEPSFIISNESFATCMLKNLELDEIFNSQNLQETNNPNSNQTTAISFLPTTHSNNLKNHTFFIYGRDTKNVYMVDNKYELKSWIDSINLISALASVELHINLLDVGIFSSKTSSPQETNNPINASSNNVATGSNINPIIDKENKYYEVMPVRNTFLVDRIMKKTAISESDSILTLLEYLYSVRRLQHLVPLSIKTKEVLMSSGKILNIKLEWLWYEQCRTRAFINILKGIENNKLIVKKEDKHGIHINDIYKDDFSCLMVEP